MEQKIDKKVVQALQDGSLDAATQEAVLALYQKAASLYAQKGTPGLSRHLEKELKQLYDRYREAFQELMERL